MIIWLVNAELDRIAYDTIVYYGNISSREYKANERKFIYPMIIINISLWALPPSTDVIVVYALEYQH